MQKIEDFLSEVSRCDYNALNQGDNINNLSYNNIKYLEGTESYHNHLNQLYEGFRRAIWNALEKGQDNIIKATQYSCLKAKEIYKDIPTRETLVSYLNEKNNGNASIKQTIEEITFIRDMSGLQDHYLNEAIKWLSSILPQEQIPSITEQERTVEAPKGKAESATKDKIQSKNITTETARNKEYDIDYISKLKELTQEVYTSKEVTLILGIDNKTLQRMRDNGEIGFHKKNGGSKIWYTKENILEYLNNPDMTYKKWK